MSLSKVPDGGLVRRNLLLLNMSHEVSIHFIAHILVHKCKRCHNPPKEEWKQQFLPWTMSLYTINKYSDLFSPFYLAAG